MSQKREQNLQTKDFNKALSIHIIGKWLMYGSMQVGVFNMGSTVVLVFQAPTANSPEGSSSSSDYRFCVKQGDRVRVGQALGRWKEE